RRGRPPRAGGWRCGRGSWRRESWRRWGMAGVKDRVAVVTGGANGLGREIAQVLARAGAKVAVGDLEADGVERTAAAVTQSGGDAIALVGDLTEEGPAARLLEAGGGRWGTLDLLLNNAGGSRNPQR